MKKTLVQIAAFTLLAGAIAFTPDCLQAQTSTNVTPAAPTTPPVAPAPPAPPAKKHNGGPFHGKISAVDLSAKTITVGKTTYEVTSTTKVFKAGKPATLGDAVIGEEAGGSYKTLEGKKVALKVTLEAKIETK